MNVVHPDEPDEVIDMDDGSEQPDDSDEKKAQVQTQGPGQQRLAANPNIINK